MGRLVPPAPAKGPAGLPEEVPQPPASSTDLEHQDQSYATFIITL